MANTTLRAVREGLRLTQDEFAKRIREAGERLNERNDCTLRTVQRWESGAVSYPRRHFIRAIEAATGYSIDQLGFDYVAKGGSFWEDHDAGISGVTQIAQDTRIPGHMVGGPPVSLSGIWESRCTYKSSSRDESFVDLSHLVLSHVGNQMTARSIDGSITGGGSLIVKLEQRIQIVTGTWEQKTGDDSYYQGQIFHGAVQMHIDATGTMMKGAWTGFGRDFDVNTGPWEMLRRDSNTRNAGRYAFVPGEQPSTD
ncbi:hypothetical protein GCM10029976_029190 [Kribbella albertanoniae]|uniref:XRE family transcriptional regulator n=1 Tax=Kribbella albertanoniae TaxID=1266829 RepID=A0A4R4NYV9_9ACTN|nr:helix-turn-helix transcriptional regulator [Kribbella albertanoniae]TDC15111.1 XRE family transcriptional regulator [Kribbella albertanoniae]